MASIFSPTTPGGLDPLSELRIVLLGKVGSGKSKVSRALLGVKEPKGEQGMCIMREGEASGRRICVVDTPGWDRVSIERTPGRVKNEIIRSVTLYPPGPHALLLVLPVENLTDMPSSKELKTASRHMELLSERVWRHTIVLFVCNEETEEAKITDNVLKASKLLGKCGGRHYVLKFGEDQAQIQGLLQEIDKMVKENCGDSFLPEVYYNLFQSQIPQDLASLKRMYESREEQLNQEYRNRNSAVEETVLKKRRQSFEITNPNMKEDDQTMDATAVQKKYHKEMLTLVRYYSKPVTIIIVAIIGALIGSVSGSVYGIVGAVGGIVIGVFTAILLTLWVIQAIQVARQSSVNLQEGKQSI